MIKVRIANNLQYAGTAITIVAKRADGYHHVLPFDLTFAPLRLGEMTTPCLVVHEEEGDELLHALAQGLAEAGYLPDISIEKQHELDATKYHLEDMRSLVFKKGK